MKLTPRYDGPAILSIAGTPDDQLAPLVRQRRRLVATLTDLDERDWSAATRCEGWTVQDVVSHLVTVDSYWHMSIASGLSGTPTRLLDGFDPAATPPLMVAPMRALSPAQVLEQFSSATDAFLGAVAELDDAGWSTLAETPAGHVPIRLLASHALWDCWIHERDIALPLGLTPPEEPDEVLSSLRYAAVLSPAILVATGRDGRGVFAVETTDPDSRFEIEVGESVALHDGTAFADAPCLRGDAVELVEALSIRAPLPDSTPDAWARVLEGLELAFDAEPASSGSAGA